MALVCLNCIIGFPTFQPNSSPTWSICKFSRPWAKEAALSRCATWPAVPMVPWSLFSSPLFCWKICPQQKFGLGIRIWTHGSKDVVSLCFRSSKIECPPPGRSKNVAVGIEAPGYRGSQFLWYQIDWCHFPTVAKHWSFVHQLPSITNVNFTT